MTDEKKAELYLDFMNNFLSIDRFAKHYGLRVSEANEIYREGKEIHELNVLFNK